MRKAVREGLAAYRVAGGGYRLRNLFRIKANRALDRMDDPRESLDDSYDRQVDMLAQLRRGLAEVATARKRIELQGEEIGARYERLGDQAQEAMDQGREDLARIALERRAALEQEMKEAAQALEFEKAAQLRDRVLALKDLQLGLPAKAAGLKGIGAKGVLGSGAIANAAAMGTLRGSRRPQQRRRRR